MVTEKKKSMQKSVKKITKITGTSAARDNCMYIDAYIWKWLW